MNAYFKKRLFIRLTLGISLLLLAMGCSQSNCRLDPMDEWLAQEDKIKVLSTVGMVDDLVGQVGGEYVARQKLISGALDPHSYELVKGDNEKLMAADIIFYSGLNLEHGPSLIHYLREHPQAVAIGDAIAREVPTEIIQVGGQTDPHIWMDVSLWLKGVNAIVIALSQKDPEHAEAFQRNGKELQERLYKLHEEMREVLNAVPLEKRYLVTTHDAFNYFVRSYLAPEEERINGAWVVRCKAPEGLSPEGQLSTTDIYHIIDHLVAHRIEILFPESNLSRDSIKKIMAACRDKGIEVRIAATSLYADAMGEPGSDGDTYEKMMRHNAQAIATNIQSEK